MKLVEQVLEHLHRVYNEPETADDQLDQVLVKIAKEQCNGLLKEELENVHNLVDEYKNTGNKELICDAINELEIFNNDY